ncbi:MAG: SMC-Scp complex subunit ScpB [Lachnospiraceae bacterium]|jgi:segregation and condensation protein B|nr:SMC-Scp complex subunit ScpB [Lachnospiraceae bacterium]
MEVQRLEAAIEAILFMMGTSVELDRIAQALDEKEMVIKQTIENMMEKYQKEERGVQIIELENAYQMCTKKEMYEYLIKIAKTHKKQVLTDVLLETLSIVAYKQPVTKMDIEKIRGVKCEHAINKLVEYNLICEAGRLDAPGRPILFATTEEFLRCFGVSSLGELPMIKQDKMERWKEEAEKEAEDINIC